MGPSHPQWMGQEAAVEDVRGERKYESSEE